MIYELNGINLAMSEADELISKTRNLTKETRIDINGINNDFEEVKHLLDLLLVKTFYTSS